MFVYFGAYPTQGKYVDDKDHCGEKEREGSHGM